MKCDCECCRKRRDWNRNSYRIKRDDFLRNGGVAKAPGRPRLGEVRIVDPKPIDPVKEAWRAEIKRLHDEHPDERAFRNARDPVDFARSLGRLI